MKEPNQHIDKIFRDLKEGSFEVPTSFIDDLNERLDKEFPASKKKRFPFWIFLVLPILAFSMYVGLRETPDQIASKNTGSTKESSTKKSTARIAKSNEKTAQNQQTANSNNLNSEEWNSAESADSVQIKRTEIASQAAKQKKFPISTNSKSTHKKKNLPTVKTTRTKNKPNDFPANEKHKTASDLAKNDPKISLDSTNFEAKEELNTLALKKLGLVPFSSDLTPALVANSIQDQGNTTLENPNSKKLGYEIQLYGGVSNSTWKRSGFMNSSIENKSIASSTFGLKSNLFYQNSTASLGLEYNQINEKLAYQTKDIQQVGTELVSAGYQIDTTIIDTMIFIDSTEIFQLSPIYDTVFQQNSQINNYSWLTIPVAFGYRFSFNKWDLIPRVGMNFNFGVSQNSGSYPNSEGNLQKYDAVRFRLDYTIQTEIRRNFRYFHVFLAPYYRGNINPMLKATDFKLGHSAWGINLGVGIKL